MISPQVIDHKLFINAYKTLSNTKFLHPMIQPNEDNFPLMLDISKLTLWTMQSKIFFKISIPILENQKWRMQKIYPIPTKKNEIFLAPLIENPYYLLNEELFINTDQEYFNKNCRNTANLYICKRNQPTHSKLNIHDCAAELVNHENSIKICQFVLFEIRELTFVPLYQENHYIVIPQHETIIDAICDDLTSQRKVISEPSAMYSEKPCSTIYGTNLMKIGGISKSISFDTKMKQIPSLNITDTSLLLDKLEQAPKISNNFKNYKNTLSSIDQHL